jgi:peptidoglycan/LPS O-acetylase OafA/YrhL
VSVITANVRRAAALVGLIGLAILALAGPAGAAKSALPPTPTTTTTTESPLQRLQDDTCGKFHLVARYHGHSAARDLVQANPLKLAGYTCPFPAKNHGIQVGTTSLSLVLGGKLQRIIPLPGPGPVTLPEMTALINDPTWLAQTSPGVFELKASVIQDPGTTINVVSPAVSVLRLDMSQADAFGGSHATANFDGVTVESWLPKKNEPVQAPKNGRPCVIYGNTSQLNILHSTMEYLGSDETSSYGVSWRVAGTNGTVNDSIFQHNFFGAYTFQAKNVIFEHSVFRDNTFYGLDPHTGSSHLTIIDNNVYGNHDHGIVFSRYVTHSLVSGNYVHGNKVNGIMMDFHSDRNVITDNIVMSGSARDNVYKNTIKNNGVGIRASHEGSNLDNIHNNTIRGGRVGVQLYGGATTTQVSKNVIKGASSFGMILDSPRSMIAGNAISGTPIGLQVLTDTTVAGGSLNVQKTGVEVGAEGFAAIRSVDVAGTDIKPLSQATGSIVQLADNNFSLPSTSSSLSGFDIAGTALLVFALLCEVLHLLRGRAVKRYALAFTGVSPGGVLVERPVSRLSSLTVRRHQPQTVEPPPVEKVTPEPTDSLRRFRPDIEGLRAVAVVFVILSHASLGLPGGYVGVDIFFVISGFLITQQLLRERDRFGQTSLVRFYARRVRRILPAATVVTCTTLIASYYLVSPLRITAIAKDAIASALFSVNWRLAAGGTNYFNAGAPPSPFQHYWSLSVEEQFYVVWPLLIIGVALLCRRKVGLKWPLTVVLAGVIGASLWTSIRVSASSPSYAYFGTHTRAWELAVGALVAVWGSKLARIPRPVAAMVAWVGFWAILWAGFALKSSTIYPGGIAQVPVYGAALIIAAGCGLAARGGPEFFLKLGLFQRTGQISYSLYLWHWPLLVLLPDFLGHTPSWHERVAAIGVAIILSIFTYVFVEHPIRGSNWLVVKPRRAMLLGVGLICTSLLVALIVGWSSRLQSSPNGPVTTPEQAAAILQASNTSGSGTPSSALTVALQAAAHTNVLPTNVTPSLAAAPTDFGMNSHGCEVGYDPTTPQLPCNEFGDPTGTTQVMMIGDSHAGMWLPAVNELAQQNHWQLTFLAKSGCPVGNYPNFIKGDTTGQTYTECNAWRAAVIARISAVKPSIVIVASEERAIAAQEPTGLTKSLEAIEKSAGKVVFLADTPNPSTDVPDCLAQHLSDISACNLPISSTETPGRLAEIAGAKAAGVAVVDPTSWFCTTTTCPAVIQNTIVYVDDSHITAAYALLREPQLAAAITSALKES